GSDGRRRRFVTRRASRRARLVLTVSESMRGEIAAQFELATNRVRRIYPGIARLRPTNDSGRRRDPLVLFVGSIFNRRHLPDLIEAFKLVWVDHPDARVDIV